MKKIGILLCDTANPFWRAKIAEYRAQAPSFGFELVFRAAEDSVDPEAQCRELRRMARESYDAVVVNPLTGDNLLPALSGLPFPVFDVGPKCDPDKTAGIGNYIPLPVADFEEQGFLAAEALISEADPTGKGRALIVGGFHDARQSVLRCRGAFRAFRRAFPQERIVTVHADFNGDDAFRAVRELAPLLDLRVVFCANDLMALGAVEALRERSAGPAIPVGGVDAIPGALEALKDGRLFCTVELPHGEVVRNVCRAVAERLEGLPPCGQTVARSVLVRRN